MALADGSTDRPCDACDVCCRVMQVPDLGKAADVPCEHLRPTGGCGIYQQRFEVCRGFACSWAVGDPLIPEDARPDRSGVLVWFEGDSVHLRELRPGALEAEPAFERALDRYGVAFERVVQRADGQRLWGGPGQPLEATGSKACKRG